MLPALSFAKELWYNTKSLKAFRCSRAVRTSRDGNLGTSTMRLLR